MSIIIIIICALSLSRRLSLFKQAIRREAKEIESFGEDESS
jgi:hypothetical protein